MRQQWFTHVRLLVTHLTRSCRAFSATLTTSALDRRSLRWFGLPTCTASPEGQPPSLAQHGLCWRLLHRPHVPFRTHGLLTWCESWCDVDSKSLRSSLALAFSQVTGLKVFQLYIISLHLFSLLSADRAAGDSSECAGQRRPDPRRPSLCQESWGFCKAARPPSDIGIRAFFVAAICFAAGFSERRAQDVIVRVLPTEKEAESDADRSPARRPGERRPGDSGAS